MYQFKTDKILVLIARIIVLVLSNWYDKMWLCMAKFIAMEGNEKNPTFFR